MDRMKKGMLREVKKLKVSGLSWKRIENFGLEYKWIAKYLQDKISYEEMIEGLNRETIKFSKSQMAWFKKDKDIKWVKGYRETTNLNKKEG